MASSASLPFSTGSHYTTSNSTAYTTSTDLSASAVASASAYMKFCKAERPKIVKDKPSLSFGEVGKELGAAWAKLSDSEKAAFK